MSAKEHHARPLSAPKRLPNLGDGYQAKQMSEWPRRLTFRPPTDFGTFNASTGLQRMRHVSRRAVVIAAFIFVSVALALTVWSLDQQGEENSDCVQVEKFSFPGPAGLSASGHTTVCSPPVASIATYVYLHAADQLPNSKNLVFRYSQRETIDTPDVRWIDNDHMLVKAMHVESISQEVKQMAAVSITYQIDSFP